MKKTGTIISMIAGALIILLAACQEMNNDAQLDNGTGNLVISITDAPFPIELIEVAEVIIHKVEIRKVEEEGEGEEEGEEDEGYPFITLSEDTMSFDLLELRNGVTEELLEMEIPAGSYDLIRLYVVEASLKVRDMDTYKVKVPSGAQTGIKIFIDPAIRVEGGLTAELLLDFNLEKSFVLKGNMNSPAGIKGFNFKPVIRAVNKTTSGGVEGIVTDTALAEIAVASVWIEQDSVVATASSDSTGYYAMIGIPEGFYSLHATKENYDTVSIEDVEIVAGNRIIQDFTLTPLE